MKKLKMSMLTGVVMIFLALFSTPSTVNTNSTMVANKTAIPNLIPILKTEVSTTAAKDINDTTKEEVRQISKAVSRGSSLRHIEMKPRYIASDLRVKSNVTAEEIDKLLANTKLAGLGEAYIMAEEEYDVNALFLVALTALESGWGQYTPQPNNISGYTAYNGKEVSSARRFNTKEACIMATAKLLGEKYLTEDGKYFNGYRIQDVNKKYSLSKGQPNTSWAVKINSIANKLLTKIPSRNK